MCPADQNYFGVAGSPGAAGAGGLPRLGGRPPFGERGGVRRTASSREHRWGRAHGVGAGRQVTIGSPPGRSPLDDFQVCPTHRDSQADLAFSGSRLGPFSAPSEAAESFCRRKAGEARLLLLLNPSPF